MGRGRPPKPGTVEEKAAARREQVRNNVRALRQRRKHQATVAAVVTNGSCLQLKWSDADVSGLVSDEEQPEPKHGDKEDRPSLDPASRHLSANLYLIDQQVDIGHILSSRVDTKNLYALALLATFRKLFLPDKVHLPSDPESLTRRPWDSQQLLWTPCAFFVTTSFANASAQDTSLIKTTLLSIGLLLKGLEFDDQSLRAAAMEMYRRALKGIRARLDLIVQGKPQSQDNVITLWQSCHAAALFELIENPDPDATHRHLRGVGLLICHMADTFDEEGRAMAWSLLQDYRFAEMGLCLRSRYTSFSSIAKRKFEEAFTSSHNCEAHSTPTTLPRGCHSRGIFVILADLADDVSAIMLRFDVIQLQPIGTSTLAELKNCLEELDKIWQRFSSLEAQLLESYREAMVNAESESDDGLMTSYSFKRYDVATAWCSNLMAQLYCLETFIEVTTLLMKFQADLGLRIPVDIQHPPASEDAMSESVDDYTLSDRLNEHRRLLRAICVQLSCSLPSFWQIDKGLPGQALAMYPLEAAIAMLTKETKRLGADLTKAQLTRRKQYVDTVLKEMVRISSAREIMYDLHIKARQFGMPTLQGDDQDVKSPTSLLPD